MTEPIRIVILQRGWTMVGKIAEDGDQLVLTDAKVIRCWGTTKGLGEIAADGPTPDTVLDPAGRVLVHKLTVVAQLDCNREPWKGVL